MGLCAVYTEGGDPVDVVKLLDVAEPRDPGPGQVVVRVALFPIHWGDLQAIQLSSPTGLAGAGVEATGVVEKVGPGVHHVTPGARVSVFPQPGAWAERFTADAQFVVPVPESVADEVAAQMLVNPLTVLMLRREAEKHFTTGYDGVVLNNAAGGAVGRLVTAGFSNHQIATVSMVRRLETAQQVLSPGARAAVLLLTDDAGHEHRQPAVVLVSNNPYALDQPVARGTRPALDSGKLGILVLDAPGDRPHPPARTWTAAYLEVEAPATSWRSTPRSSAK